MPSSACHRLEIRTYSITSLPSVRAQNLQFCLHFGEVFQQLHFSALGVKIKIPENQGWPCVLSSEGRSCLGSVSVAETKLLLNSKILQQLPSLKKKKKKGKKRRFFFWPFPAFLFFLAAFAWPERRVCVLTRRWDNGTNP